MHIQHITLSHFLNHQSFNLPVAPDARVLFVCGGNGTGKTGLAQAIKLALTGDLVRGLKYKNQLSELITQGEKDGQVAVTVDTEGTVATYRLNLHTGKASGDAGPSSLDALALDPDDFMALDANERRKSLFRIAGIKLNSAAIVLDLTNAGHAAERVQRIVSALRGGFDTAAQEAATAATEARGGWKAITGETYGSTKGEHWKATAPLLDVTTPVDVLQRKVNDAKQHADKLNAEHAALKQAAQAHAAVADTQGVRDALTKNEKGLLELRAEREALSKEVDAIRNAAQYKGGQTCPCPACGVILYWNSVGVLKEWDEAKPAMPPPAAHQALQGINDQLAELDRRIQRVQQAVADGKAAAKLMHNLPPEPAPGAVREAEGRYRVADAELAVVTGELNAAKDGAAEVEKANARTAQAAALHADVVAFAALADAVKELPGRYLTSALKQVQALLDEANPAFEYPVTLGADMELRYGNIPYGLASDSQQWRMRAALGYALAVIGTLGIVVLDRFDVLQPTSRGPVLKWLAQQQRVQVVLCATLKAVPKLPEPPFQVAWLGSP